MGEWTAEKLDELDQEALRAAEATAFRDYETAPHFWSSRRIVEMVVANSIRTYLAQARSASFGWLFHNPDMGEEWSKDHPVESGEVPDAQNIRAATAEVMVAAYRDRCTELVERAEANAEAWGRVERAKAQARSASTLRAAALPLIERLNQHELDQREVRGLEAFDWQEIGVNVGELRALRKQAALAGGE